MEVAVKTTNGVNEKIAIETLFSYLDKGIDDMEAGRMQTVDEAVADIFELVKYIHTDLCSPNVAEKLFHNLNREINVVKIMPSSQI